MKNIEDVYKLSPRQRDLFAQGVGAGQRVEHLCCTYRREIDEAALERAVRELGVRHPAFRTAFFAQGLNEPVQAVRQKVELGLERRDLGDVAEGDAAALLAADLVADRRRGMNLSAAPLARWALLRCGRWGGFLVLAHHPLVIDRASAHLCLGDLFTLYQAALSGQEGVLERGRPFRDYVAWLEQQDQKEAASFFKASLGDTPPPPGPGEAANADPSGVERLSHRQRVVLPAKQAAELQSFLRQQRISLATLLQAAWALVLGGHERGGALFGIAVAGRPAALGRSETMVGSFAGVLPRRIAVPAERPLANWLQELEVELSRLFKYEQTSLSQIRTWIGGPPEHPLFQSVVAVEMIPGQGGEDDPVRWLGRRLGFHDLHPVAAAPAPLVLTAVLGQSLALEMEYGPEGSFAQIHRLIDGLASLLGTMVAQPYQNLASLQALTRSLVTAGQTAPVAPVAPIPAEGGDGLGPSELETLLLRHRIVHRVAVRRAAHATGERWVAHVALDRVQLPVRPSRKLDFSLFYFADANAASSQDKYRLYLEGAKFADRHGFAAVWTPERHFHLHGGLYPSPAVLTAALATTTERVQLRAGSVVLPLHHPFRVAEDWAILDNLSRGRVGISVASGWVPDDFVLAPESYERRREVMFERLDQVLRLWRGEAVAGKDGLGNDTETRIYPRPLQASLPVWLTCAGNPDTFRQAGDRGFNVLTALLYQSLDEATRHIALYREAREHAGHDPAGGHATLMLHTFLGRDADEVLDTVRGPLTEYLRSHVSLMESLVKSMNLPFDIRDPQLVDQVAAFAFERYYRTSALTGTPTSCLPLIDRVLAGGADEIACLIDFGVEADRVLGALEHLLELKRLVEDEQRLVARLLSEYLSECLPRRTLPPIDFAIDPPA